MNFALLFAAFLLLLVPGIAVADRGFVPTEDVNVAEPAQRAIIVHNGSKELIILQTEVSAAAESRIVEFMPLPSKPEVSLAPEGCFEALAEIVKIHDIHYLDPAWTKYGDPRPGEEVKIVFHEQLGPHGVTVAMALSAPAFVDWIKKFFQDQKLGSPIISRRLEEIVADYIRRGIFFFAIDIIDVGPEIKTIQPLAYLFDSVKAYYPLKVSNLFGGEGAVELFWICPERRTTGVCGVGWLSTTQAGNGKYYFSDFDHPTRPSPSELSKLHPLIPKLLPLERGRLFAEKYVGPLSFQDDINVASRLTMDNIDQFVESFFAALTSGDRLAVFGHLDTPFYWNRTYCTQDRHELLNKIPLLFEEIRGIPLENKSAHYRDILPVAGTAKRQMATARSYFGDGATKGEVSSEESAASEEFDPEFIKNNFDNAKPHRLARITLRNGKVITMVIGPEYIHAFSIGH